MQNDNTYRDLMGRKFNSLKSLCDQNHIDYSRCYRLYKKGKPLNECIKDGLEYRNQIEEKKKASCFSPESKKPGIEYIRYLKFYIERSKGEIESKKGWKAVEAYENLIKPYEEELKYVENDKYWLTIMDAIACGDERTLAVSNKKTVDAAKLLLTTSVKNHKGLFGSIYGLFSEKYKLGIYADDNKEIANISC
jgi:hypothetical protein